MTESYEVRYDPVALRALEESATYILEQSGPVRAADWLAAMRSSIEELSSTPRAYPW